MKKLLTIVLAVTLMTIGSVASAASVGINLGSNEQSLAAGDVAGVTVAQSNWNNASGASGSLSNVNNNSGVATTLDVSWSVNTTWHVTANGTATGDGKLMFGYADVNSGQTKTVTLTQIPYTTYDVYVYVGGSNSGTNTGKVGDGITTYSFQNASRNPGGDGFQQADYIRTTDTGSGYPAANYALFAGRTGASRTISHNAISQSSGMFGVQIVDKSPPGAATNPSPAHTATNVGVTTDLSWTAGSGATSHNVYFGTVSPGTSRGNQTATTYDTGTMPNNTTHYWRIDEVNSNGTTTGTVWSFTTIVAAPGVATTPSPANGATNVGITTDISWTAGSGATSHNVYFGTASPGTSRGNQTATSWDTGTMPNNTTHYWRIDEVNAGGTTTGTVWSFTTKAQVPNVVGSTQAAATTAITGAGLVVGNVTTAYSETVPAGDVISQDPVGGTQVNVGSAVDMVVSLGLMPLIPDVTGMTQAEAEAAIVAATFTVGNVTTAYSDTVAEGDVISQDPVGGTPAASGTPVDLVVSDGPSPRVISGYIKNACNVAIKDVAVSANNGGGSDITDPNGFYEVVVDYDWSGTVTPSKTHYTFDPNSLPYTNVIVDMAEQNYAANNIYDLDCDGSIGLGDLMVMCENWLVTGVNVPGDLHEDDDDIVNLLDFAEFASVWGD
jgi:hypothetical protein